MTQEDLWRLKVTAVLHDPPQKALLLERGGGHEAVARGLVEAALGAGVEESLWQRAKAADRIASAADRIDFPEEAQACWWRRPILRHPLSGKVHSLDSLTTVDVDVVNERVRRTVEAIRADCGGDPEKIFLCLWRRLGDELKAAEGERLGALWDLLPADTRQPQHTIWDHNRIVSALAGAIPQAALLVMSIGPVQDFIASARKTQDLWAGSWILSYLAWQGMQAIAARWGPDAVLFPALRGQPLVDLWLRSTKEVPGIGEPDRARIQTPSLPNRWVAVLPADRAEDVAAAAADAVRGGCLDLAANARRLLGSKGVEVEDSRWGRQQDWIEVYWTVHRWPAANGGEPAEFGNVLDAALGRDAAFERLLHAFEQSGKYRPNLGTCYGRLHTLADRAHGSRKTVRDFAGGPGEPGYKCTLCGEREPAAPASGDSSDHGRLVGAWKEIAGRLGPAVVEGQGRERLCAVCLTKRLVPSILDRIRGGTDGPDGKAGPRARFPSTSEVAATTFKCLVLDRARESDPLRRALKAFVDAVPEDRPVAGRCAPATCRAAERLGHALGDRETWRRIAMLDGEWFFPETYDSDDAGERLGAGARMRMRQHLGAHLREADALGIARPAPYYAVLFLDGDQMGRWVSGTHEGLPTIEESLHEDAVDACRAAFGDELLRQRRPQSPSLQGALSGVLLGFGLHVARHVVEERHCGTLVYAGGDDVFAVAPVDGVLALAGDLEAAFRQPALVAADGVRLGPDALARDPRAQGGTVHLGMGDRATASAGIAVAHHRQPLGQVLEAARRMEKRAKRDLGRAAFSVALLRRSGEESEAGAKWRLDGLPESLPDTVAVLEKLVGLFGDPDGLSPRLLGDLRQEQAGLAALPPPAWERRLAWLLRRHAGERRRAGTADLARALCRLIEAIAEAEAARQERQGLAPSLRRPIEAIVPPARGWAEAVELVALAAFLARHAGRKEAA